MSNLFVRFLRALNVPHTERYANKLFDEHPYKYNLLGISQLLDHYNIETKALEVDKNNLDALPVPFIAVVSGDFGVVESVTKEKVNIHIYGRFYKMNRDHFMGGWIGIALFAGTSDASREPGYKPNFLKAAVSRGIVLLTLAALAVLLIRQIVNYGEFIPPLQFYVPLGLSLLGLGICILLCIKKLNDKNRFVEQICTMLKNNDCSNVLNSQAGSLFGMFSWNEIGTAFFLSNLSVLLFFPSFFPWIVWVDVLALPFTLWSVFYQWKVVKQWCVLCLAVQAVLWLLFFAYLGFGMVVWPGVLTWTDLVSLIAIFAVPVLGVKFFLKYIEDTRIARKKSYNLLGIKAQKRVFEALSKNEPYYDTTGSSDIVFGNPESGFQITVLTNPYCNPCAKFHKRVGPVLDRFKDKVMLRYVLTSFDEKLEKINYILIGYYMDHTMEESERFFARWYEERPADEILERYAKYLTDERVIREIDRQKEWAGLNGLSATPTILVNGYKLPKLYEIEELTNVITDYIYS